MSTDHAPRSTTRSSSVRHLAVTALVVATVSACGTAGAGSADGPGAPAAPVPSAQASPTARDELRAGTSYFAGADVGVTVMLPEGWLTEDVFVIKAGADPTTGLVFSDVVNIYSDPCRWVLLDPPVGPTVDDLVAAFSASTVFDVGEASDVTVDGYPGRRLEVTVPDYETEDCTFGKFGLFKEDGPDLGTGDGPNFWAQAPGERLDLWVLDVDGTRLVVGAGSYPGTPPEDLAAMEAMVSSLQIG